MKTAVLSDIHGNLEALSAVLADIREQGIEMIHCLGDIVGYGPNPRECIAEMRSADVCILGNHDEAIIIGPDPDEFGPPALQAALWTRDQLCDADIEFLRSLPRSYREESALLVHGSPNDPTNEYVFPMDVNHPGKMADLFDRFEQRCFLGHTHLPGVFRISQFLSPDELDQSYFMDDEQLMINVGSVGQPRDGDPRSCYVVLENGRLTYRRVEYDVETTVKKIYRINQLDNSLGDRLRHGC